MSSIEDLKQINKFRKFLQEHPVIKYDMEEKLNYLYGLAIYLNCDGQIDNRKKFLKIIISIMGIPSNFYEDVISVAKDSDPLIINDIILFVKENDLSLIFINDLILFKNIVDENVDKFDESYYTFCDLLEIEEFISANIRHMHNILAAKNWVELYYFLAHSVFLVAKTLNNIFLYYDMSFDKIEKNYIQKISPKLYFNLEMSEDFKYSASIGFTTNIGKRYMLIPVTISLFADLLQKLDDMNRIKTTDDGNILDIADNLLLSIKNTNLDMDIDFIRDYGNHLVTGITSRAVRILAETIISKDKYVYKVFSLPFQPALFFEIYIKSDDYLLANFENLMNDSENYYKIVENDNDFSFKITTASFTNKVDSQTLFWLAIGELQYNR